MRGKNNLAKIWAKDKGIPSLDRVLLVFNDELTLPSFFCLLVCLLFSPRLKAIMIDRPLLLLIGRLDECTSNSVTSNLVIRLQWPMAGEV